MDNKSFFTQYEKRMTGYTPTNETTKRLPAGVYKLKSTMMEPMYQWVELATDSYVALTDSITDKIAKEIARFWTLGDKFRDLGFVHKRGILLHSAPGAGKSCLINQLAKDVIKDDGIVLIANNMEPSDVATGIQNLRQIEPTRNMIVVFEDIESELDIYGEEAMLSLLDGQATVSGVVFIATTNFIEKISPRFRNRPSRFDWVIEVPMPDAKQRTEFLTQKSGLSSHKVNQIVELTNGFSMAQLKEIIVSVALFSHEIKEVVDRVRSLATEHVTTNVVHDEGDEPT